MNMKKISCFIIFIIFVSVSPLKSEAKALSVRRSDLESIASFIYPNFNVEKSNLNKENYENSNERVFDSSLNEEDHKYLDAGTIPVYFIMSPKADIMRTRNKKTPKYTNFFNEKGMIYITKPKATRDGQPRISILDDMEAIARRSYTNYYDLTRKNQRALKSFVNQELNKKLVAKNAMRRFLDKYDKEYKFNDLVM